MLKDPRIRGQLAGGVSITVATADADAMPTMCRAVGARIGDDEASVVVYLPVAAATKTVANLATNGRVALVSSDILTYGTVQLKGRSREVRIAHESERAMIESWHEAFVERAGRRGMPPSLTRALTNWPAFAVDVEVTQVFEQTPGPRAGTLVSAT